jgi:sugar O-acyltransferase (sialic acid O-acetyltransferase NeuD family)
MEEIIAIGGGGHSRVVLTLLRKLKLFKVIGYTDRKDCGLLSGVPYLGGDAELESIAKKGVALNAVISVGQVGLGHRREEIGTYLRSLDLTFPSIVSPDSVVNEHVSLAEGVVVMDGAIINCGASIGEGSIVNTNSTIEHDVQIGDWVHVAPGATISGGVTVGRHSMIGAGATVIEGINISSACMVGAGAVVIHDLIEPGIYVGCPARRMR